MINFFKGIAIGIGGIAPGLSGSVMLVIFGLYDKCIYIISHIFKDFKKNMKFLIPIGIGGCIGIVLFSKLIEYLLNYHEMYTRYAFLGLVIGTVPLFFNEVKKEGFNKRYLIPMIIAFLIGISLLFVSKNMIPILTDLNVFQSILLGVVIAGSMLVPGVDSAVILTTFGLYDIFVLSISDLKFNILIPAGFGFVISGIVISYCINKLLKKAYGYTFSTIFGLFLAIIPSVILFESCKLGFNMQSFVCIIITLVCIILSYRLGKLKK